MNHFGCSKEEMDACSECSEKKGLLVVNAMRRDDNLSYNQTYKVRSTVFTFGISFTPIIVDQASLINNFLTWDIKW